VIAATSAPVYVSLEAPMSYPHEGLKHGQRLRLDGAEVEVIASPGHTPEHVSYALRTGEGPPALFSGGALTAGAAARTDLLTPELTEPLTRAQFRTVHMAFTGLPDETLLLPTHGGGSFCTAGSGGERTSTLGRERATNPLMLYEGEDEFMRWFPTTFPAVPAYFARMREVNVAGPRLRRDIAMPGALSPEVFREAAKDGLIVDVRPVEEYARGHIEGSLSDAFRPSYATWLGWLAPLGTPLLFVLPDAGEGLLDAVVDESLLVGQERFVGWLEGGMEAWERAGLPLRALPRVEAEAAREVAAEGVTVVDVREPDEYESGHVSGALSIPLGRLQGELGRVPRGRPVLTYCAMGERSTTAASVLERNGFADVQNLEGGIEAWRAAGQQVTV
jgi:rhodanese-related sulfurtransferase